MSASKRRRSGLYNSRVAPGLNSEQRSKMVFEETALLEEELYKKSLKTSIWSNFFSGLNTILNIIVILSSAVIVTVTAINNFQNLTAIILGGVIFAISGISALLKLSDRGFNYRKGTVRLRRIRGQVRDILYMFHTYTSEQVLAFLSSFRSELDDIDLDLYQTGLSGEAKFGNGLRVLEHSNSNPNSQQSTPLPRHDIHIHIDPSPENSPYNSPRDSPHPSPHPSPQFSHHSSAPPSPNRGNLRPDRPSHSSLPILHYPNYPSTPLQETEIEEVVINI